MAKNTYPRLSDIDGLTFHQLPVDGGQIVDISYAVDEGYLYTRRWDRSDNSTRVWREEIDETSETEFEPQNGQLPETNGDEEPVYADDLADMMELLERYGDRFAGNSSKDIAGDWMENGFDAGSASDWMDIGVWDAATAAEFRDAELTPAEIETAAESMSEGDDAEKYTDGCPIYAACNNDISPRRIIDVANETK